MRNDINKNRQHDPRINYRGTNASRIDNFTDAVFSIAITLLIFNLANPNSFSDLLNFTKTLPAFLISIGFLALIWNEHLQFSEIYTLNDTRLTILNTLFIALVIFYVYPLRFLTLFLTNFFFQTGVDVNIQNDQVPYLMIYYGAFAFALYFVLYLFYQHAANLKKELNFNEYEVFYTKSQKRRLLIMFAVPLISIVVTLILNHFSFILASVMGGVTYCLYTPLIIFWHRKFEEKSKSFDNEQTGTALEDRYAMKTQKPNYIDMGYARTMGPKLRQVVEAQLLTDLENYLPKQSNLKFDWSESCIEGKCTDYLDGSIDRFSDISLFDENDNLVADGWMEFIHAGEFFQVYWDKLTTWDRNKKLTEKKKGIPKHIWQQIPDDIKPGYISERE